MTKVKKYSPLVPAEFPNHISGAVFENIPFPSLLKGTRRKGSTNTYNKTPVYFPSHIALSFVQ